MWPVAALLDSADEGQHLHYSKFCWTALLWTATTGREVASLGSLCRWPCENEYIFAALHWRLPALFCLLLVSWMVWEWAPYCPPYRRRCDEWGHGGCCLPWHVTHQWQNPPWSCSPPESGLLLGHHGVGPAGTSLTGAPEEYLACVEAGTEHTSAGPNWNYSRTSDLIFLQEQMKAMWQLFTTCL